MASLTFGHLHKRYGDVVALTDLDLDIPDDELIVVVGPSGCGKTTALRIVAGLEDADGGVVRIDGRDVTAVESGDRNVAMVFQSHALFPHLSVEENIGFGMRARGAESTEVRRAVEDAARLVGCETLLDRRPDEISGGERQRVALARGLVRRPDVFLLDEPLSNLDAQLRAQMRRELRRLHREVGGTMVHVTHDQVEALTLGDRVAVLRRGTLQQVGTGTEVYRRPANRFVATFIGSPPMGMLPATVDDGALRVGGAVLDLPADRVGAVDRGAAVEIGIRPEHLRLAADDPTGDGDTLRGVVVSTELVGSDAYTNVDLDGGELTVRHGPGTAPAQRATVRLAVDAADLHLFDAATGVALR